MAKSEAGIELAVAVLVVARVVFPILQSQAGTLWCEATGVVILTSVALFAEFQGRKQLLDHLKPRSSMSSGILLGAVTVPTLLSARLLQLQRCCSSTENSQSAIDRMKFDFWLALACSMTVIDALLQGLILGLFAMPVILKRLYRRLPSVFGWLDDQSIPEKQSRKELYMNYRAGSFYLLLLAVVFAAVPLWVGVVTGYVLNPVIWTLRFVWRRNFPRLVLCFYWIVIICSPLPHLYRISDQMLVPKILIRKYYHVMIVFMFIPALLLDPQFLQLAFGVAFAAFLVAEMIRIGKLPPCGHLIERFMVAFTDHRDSGSLIISHFSLLLGCALPVWLNSGAGDRPLAAYAGILSLGVMDTLASVVGFNFGSMRVSPNSKKTVEGTLAGIVSMLASVLILIVMLPSSARPGGVKGYLSLVAAVTGAGIVEAYTLQLDNAFIPLLFYAMLCL
ncbi:hypothetical protein Mapa_010753 [Marchantia paleacea]|nr:hypothetical protein Mapa_010753 [Marchantia paleacea]